MKYLYGKYIQDGKLDQSCGRIVIYDDHILHSRTPSADHNDLLRSLAARIVEDRNNVIGKGIRLYYKREYGRIIVSPVRKWDDDMFHARYEDYAQMIKRTVK